MTTLTVGLLMSAAMVVAGALSTVALWRRRRDRAMADTLDDAIGL